jgi:hypothetical protein
MWAPVRKLLAKSPSLAAAFGEVIWESREVASSLDPDAHVRFRVKRALDGRLVVSTLLRGDSSSEGGGVTRRAFETSFPRAREMLAELSAAIEVAERLEVPGSIALAADGDAGM